MVFKILFQLDLLLDQDSSRSLHEEQEHSTHHEDQRQNTHQDVTRQVEYDTTVTYFQHQHETQSQVSLQS